MKKLSISLLALSFVMCFTMCTKKDKSANNDDKQKTVKFYRIKQVDKDGNVTYSTVKKVEK